jgi:CubicO group peptidase (beta-lactamase class C family)
MKRRIFFWCLLSFTAFTLSAQTSTIGKVQVQGVNVLKQAQPETVGMSSERLKRIDANMNEWLGTGKLNGAVALIVRNGKIVYHNAFGYDDLDKTRAMKPDMIFRIASQQRPLPVPQ